MDEDPEVAVKRKEFYAAQNLFKVQPTPETKAAYKAASNAFNLALHHAGVKAATSGALAVESESKSSAAISAEDAAIIDAARLAQNAAHRAMYADPGPETRAKWNQARNEYKKVRRQLDPDFRAMLSESTRKSAAKAKG